MAVEAGAQAQRGSPSELFAMVCTRPELASMSFALIFRDRRLELTAESSEVATLIVRTLQRGCGQQVDVDSPSTNARDDRSSVTSTAASPGEPRVWWDFSAANSKTVPRVVTFDLPPPLLEASVPPPPPEEELVLDVEEEAEEAEEDPSMPSLQLALFRLDAPTFGPAVPLVVPLPTDGSALLLANDA